MTLARRALRFRWTASLFLVGAGVGLCVQGGALLESSWAPGTIALTHLGTLGFLTLALMGLVYERAVGRAGAQLPGVLGIEGVYAGMLLGVALLVGGLSTGERWPLFAALLLFVIVVPVFVLGVLRALRGVRGDLVASALRISLWSLLGATAIGTWMLHGHAGLSFPGSRPLWLQVHLSVALLGWFGAAFAALCEPAPRRRALGLIALGVLAPPAVLVADAAGSGGPLAGIAALAAIPAAATVWLLAPLGALRAPADDAGGELRRAGFAFAPGVALAAVWVLAADWNVAFGWLALWGWAGLVVHGLLLRGVPRPGGLPAAGMALHLAALAAGLGASLSGFDPLARVAGALLAATGICQVVALRHGRPPG